MKYFQPSGTLKNSSVNQSLLEEQFKYTYILVWTEPSSSKQYKKMS